MNIEKILQKYPRKKEYLIEMLLDVDDAKEHHFISEDELRQIAKYVATKESHVCSVMSFYTLLSTAKRGKYVIQVCRDVPCYIADDFNVLNTIEDELGITIGETTGDFLFSLEFTACIGCCDEAPAIRINHDVFTNLSRDKIGLILDSYRGDIQ